MQFCHEIKDILKYLGTKAFFTLATFFLLKSSPSTTSTHFLRTLGIPFQFVDEPSEATEHGESRTGTGFDVEGVEDFLSCNSGIVPSTERITEF